MPKSDKGSKLSPSEKIRARYEKKGLHIRDDLKSAGYCGLCARELKFYTRSWGPDFCISCFTEHKKKIKQVGGPDMIGYPLKEENKTDDS